MSGGTLAALIVLSGYTVLCSVGLYLARSMYKTAIHDRLQAESQRKKAQANLVAEQNAHTRTQEALEKAQEAHATLTTRYDTLVANYDVLEAERDHLKDDLKAAKSHKKKVTTNPAQS